MEAYIQLFQFVVVDEEGYQSRLIRYVYFFQLIIAYIQQCEFLVVIQINVLQLIRRQSKLCNFC